MSQTDSELTGWPSWLAVPPTQDELPYDDGEPMESNQHVRQMLLLIDTLQLHWAERSDFFVGGNMFLYFSALQIKKNDFRGPDVFVALDVDGRKTRKSWVVWEEGKSPDVVIELLSESTERVDRGEKMRIYERVMRVPVYVLFDPVSGALEVYSLDSQFGYRRVDPDDQGHFPVPILGLGLGVVHGTHRMDEADWLRWFTSDGHVVRTSDEIIAAQDRARAEAEQGRAEAEQGRAELAARLAEYERRFGRLPE